RLNRNTIKSKGNRKENGFAAERALGEAFRQMGVPVGRVYTSHFNRAYETAVLAGFNNIEKTADLTEGGLVVSPNENNRRAAAFKKLVATAPEAGTSTVLVTHKPKILDALGKDWSEVKEGEASIFRPANGNYTLVARVQMDEWPRQNREVTKMTATTPFMKGEERLGPLASRYVDVDSLPWKPTPCPGIDMKILVEATDTGLMTALFRWQGGAKLVLHEHVEVEQTFVIEGSLVEEEGEVTAGNYVWRPKGNRHTARSPKGALVLSMF